MKKFVQENKWHIRVADFDPSAHEARESLFSLGNGRIGQRANFEEFYSGKSLAGNYVAGVYYPDKTRVGWWKNGYPEYFAKVLNAPNWMALDILIDGVRFDLNSLQVLDYNQELNMKESVLRRSARVKLSSGKIIGMNAVRLLHATHDCLGLINYEIYSEDGAEIVLHSALDGHVKNADSNYDETFWEAVSSVQGEYDFLQVKTRKSGFDVGYLAHHTLKINEEIASVKWNTETRDMSTRRVSSFKLAPKSGFSLEKRVVVLSSLDYSASEIYQACADKMRSIASVSFDDLVKEHVAIWAEKWKYSDILIEGDTAAQQGIRFNILQLNHTYSGKDARLNIGPKGFTGEKYGGSTYWDTEAYCLPFYLSTSPQKVARQLLEYRYKQLDKAIENAAKLGFKNGAALYPMVTMNGEECHNEWEITFEEIHRNGAIAFAIFNYIRYTGDSSYLVEGGLDVLIGIARFWHQRFNWSEAKQAYVMLGVTGPNEYENNINNNWYTSYIARWCLHYTLEAIRRAKQEDAGKAAAVLTNLSFDDLEAASWEAQSAAIFLPESKELGIYLQQEGYLDKEQIMAADLPASQRPINQHWSWDRILRSCFIKQADVLQGIYFFESNFTEDEIRRNFDFYEPRTVHESSLSPCVHSILAAKLGYEEKAYEMYLRTSRLDLDDYNNEVHEGLHITSMAGTWLSVVQGFGGMRTHENGISFFPMLPKQWNRYAFKIRYRNSMLEISTNKKETKIVLLEGEALQLAVYGESKEITLQTPGHWSLGILSN